MGLKLIKKHDRNAAQAKAVSFSENTPDVEAAGAADPPWMQAGRQVTGPERSQAGARPADPALVEKLAYESGLRQGEKAGMELAEKKVEAMMARYAQSIAELARLRSVLYARAEKEVVQLALEVARKIVHREIRADREIIQTLVRVALGHVAVKSPVTIRLHPDDYDYLVAQRARLAQDGGEEREIVLQADASIERGGCLIQTEAGDVDARIEEEFREVERAFFENGEP